MEPTKRLFQARLQSRAAQGTKVEPLAELQARSVIKVNIRLAGGQDTHARLDQLQEVFRRHPGPATLYFTFCLPPDLEADTSLIPNVKVLPNETFLADVEAVLGKGTVALL